MCQPPQLNIRNSPCLVLSSTSITYNNNRPSDDVRKPASNIEGELFAIVWDNDRFSRITLDTETLNEGLSIFKGNGTPSATPTPSETPASEVTAPETIVSAPAVTPVTTSNTYVVERGDNLSKIAKKVYGDSKYWRNIYNANSNVIKSDYTIYANQVLVIPAL